MILSCFWKYKLY